MANCKQLSDPGYVSEILRTHGVEAVNRMMDECGQVRKAARPGSQTVVKMDSEFEAHLNTALGWDGAAQYLKAHGGDALNAELQRRGISHRVKFDSAPGMPAPAGQSQVLPEYDPLFPGMRVKTQRQTPDVVKRQKTGTDPLFRDMNVPKK